MAGICLSSIPLLAQATPPQPAALTLEETIRRAEANEPTFAAAIAEGRATALERKDARAGLLPSAIYHNQYLFTQSNQTAATTTQGGLNQSLPVFIANNAVHEYYSQASVTETLGLAQFTAVRLADANAARAAGGARGRKARPRPDRRWALLWQRSREPEDRRRPARSRRSQ